MWTQFWDMRSGGGLKEKWQFIYIEAPTEEAKVIFYNRFGHNPERVTCTCCGEDYSISEHESLAQLTGYHRNCRYLATPRDPETGLYKNDDPILKQHYYLEAGEEPPPGYEIDRYTPGEYRTLNEYLADPNVHVIAADEIKKEDREGSIPQQGYVWVD